MFIILFAMINILMLIMLQWYVSMTPDGMVEKKYIIFKSEHFGCDYVTCILTNIEQSFKILQNETVYKFNYTDN